MGLKQVQKGSLSEKRSEARLTIETEKKAKSRNEAGGRASKEPKVPRERKGSPMPNRGRGGTGQFLNPVGMGTYWCVVPTADGLDGLRGNWLKRREHGRSCARW